MLATKFHINTLKESPAEAELVSHQYMTRAGMINKLAGGIYTYMPMGYRVLKKIEGVIREEMNRAGAIELLMPMVQPAELWSETGRWEKMGDELLRLKDRHGRDFALQPTSEEVITDIARNEIKSWRQLSINFYHIQTKFRDERRPRFGLMRGREFIMKDAYSFDKTAEDAKASYQNMYDAYVRIFNRLGLEFRPVQADTGAIGGSLSHEFQVIAKAGEDLIVYDPEDTSFAANIELAPAPCLIAERATATAPLEKVSTPNAPKCELVAQQLGISLEKTVKSVVFAVDSDEQVDIYLLLVRGDHEINEIKASKIPAFTQGFRLATEAEILEYFGSEPGYLGPIQTKKSVHVVADLTVAHMSDFCCGANDSQYHYTGVNWGRDLPEPELVLDLRNVVEGDTAPNGKGKLAIMRGIEVGHVFFLGDTYSKKMNATFLNEEGKATPFQMGCYGIGVSRIAAAAIEQCHDEKGIVWPMNIAPFEVVICPIGLNRSESVKTVAHSLYQELQAAGVDVILDDRDTRPGVMFAEWELIGVPLRITIGDKNLNDNLVELTIRQGSETEKVSTETIVEKVLDLKKQMLKV
ncbi:proline--tRNA ligase [Basilea psittacipulmonis]|uniref:Proline--tRNA ligase n=1 Tax=Basilea psittacipulmonis DSM 24701 TaxID=1072685 RepID=A0A077DFE9_9BURK|nr:proline--tRNA ligase [Basilea psittacipulmonis]AIL32876.1 proline--tRNA ligase [Basilea psittacipulmonis DSM 24701]